MKKSLIALAVLAACGHASAGVVRARTHDVAFTYSMGMGFAGDVNRTHPASIVPGMIDGTDPVRLYGDPALFIGATGLYRGMKAADQSDATPVAIAGVMARPYPTQQTSGGMTSTLQTTGAGVAPNTGQPNDFIDEGFILVRCNNFAATAPQKGGAVYVWCAASAGALVLGGFSSAFSAGNTAKVLNAEWNSAADANGIAEIRVWKQK